MSKSDALRAFFDVRIWLEHQAAEHRWTQDEWTKKARAQVPVEKRLTLLDRSVLHELAGFMDPSGVNGFPTAAKIAAILGQQVKSIERALQRLRHAGLIEPTVEKAHIGNPQVWQLTKPFRDRLAELAEAHRAEAHRAEGLKPERPTPPRQEPHSSAPKAPPRGGSTDKTDIDTARAASNGQILITEAEIRGLAEERVKAKGGGKGLLKTILREDRAELIAELEERHRATVADKKVKLCDDCDATGFIDQEANTRARCSHPRVDVEVAS